MAPYSSTLAWQTPWTEEPGGLQSMGLRRVGHDWVTSLSLFTFHFPALKKEMATHSSVLAWRIPGMGEPDGMPSMGSHRVGHDWSDLAAAAAALNLKQVCYKQHVVGSCFFYPFGPSVFEFSDFFLLFFVHVWCWCYLLNSYFMHCIFQLQNLFGSFWWFLSLLNFSFCSYVVFLILLSHLSVF